MIRKTFLNLFILTLVSLISAEIIGDVSISPSRQFFKKSIIERSFPQFFNERTLVNKLTRTRSILTLPYTTTKPTTFKSTIRLTTPAINTLRYRTDHWIDQIYDNPDKKGEKFDDYNPTDYNFDQKIRNQGINKQETYQFIPAETDARNLKNENEIILVTPKPIEDEEDVKNEISNNESNNPVKSKSNKSDNPLYPIGNSNKRIYEPKPVPLLNYSPMNNEVYPIVEFVNQYKCDINVTTCGLWNDPQLKDMFFLEEIQDSYNRLRCFVAHTNNARKANLFGARLITQYFHSFGMLNACFELNYFANGPGIRKMEVAQQDEETNVIWTLEDYQFNVELNFKTIRNIKIPVKLKRSEPRFFITVNLDPYKIGRIGILGFNFTYSKCDEL